MTRNPKTDPHKGDILKKGKIFRTVTSSASNGVVEINHKWQWFSTWSRWASHATLITVSPK